MVAIKKHKEEYVAGLAGVNSCPCFFEVKDGILNLTFQEAVSKITTMQLLARDIEIQFDNRSTVNTSAIAGGALLGGLAFGGIGAALGGLGASDRKDNCLIMKVNYDNIESLIYFKPSMTAANLFNQLLLFKQENNVVDISYYNRKLKEQEAANFIRTRWIVGILLIIASLRAIPTKPQMILLLLSGIILLPPVFPFLQEKYKFSLHSNIKKAIFWILFIAAFMIR